MLCFKSEELYIYIYVCIECRRLTRTYEITIPPVGLDISSGSL